jgi:Protein of unknown function (DUF3396)
VDLDSLAVHVLSGGTEYTIVRPGIALCMLYAKPASEIAPAIAEILEAYLEFIPPGALQSYLSPNGAWKKLTRKTYEATLAGLRSTRPGEFAEFHLGQEPLRNVGRFGAHFEASPLADSFFALEDNILYLEFPADLTEFTTADGLIEFVRRTALLCEFDSGFCGYAFNNLHMTFVNETFEAISHMAMRYLGFDVGYDYIRKYARGHVCNLSWLTLFGATITGQLGGVDAIRATLPVGVQVEHLGPGVMLRAADAPIIADVNRGAPDVAPLRSLAALTRKLRVQAPSLGADDPSFADRWLNRFERLEYR